MEKITIELNLINKILGYLGNRPYVEVSGLIDEIIKTANSSTPKQESPKA